jgi:hypothetical protein
MMQVGDLVTINFCMCGRKGEMAMVVDHCASDEYVIVLVLDTLTRHTYNISKLIKMETI